MTVSYSPAAYTQITTGAAANASVINSPLTQLLNSMIAGSSDIYPRQVVISLTAGESLSPGDFLRISGSTVVKTDTGSDAGITNFIGVALESKTTSQAVKIAINGVYATSGLTAGSIYYLSTSGTITATKPSSRARTVGVAISTTALLFLERPSNDVTFSSINFTDSITGNGSGLTSLNASNLGSGTVPTGRISGAYSGITGVGTLASIYTSGAITQTAAANTTLIAPYGTAFDNFLVIKNAASDSSGLKLCYGPADNGSAYIFNHFNGPIYLGTNNTNRLMISGTGNIVPGSGALATNATDGFLYLPTCAGAPTGTPTTYSGRSAHVYDTSNNKLYVYNSGWKSVTLS